MAKALATQTDNAISAQVTFEKTVDIVLDTLSSSSQRVYMRTYVTWAELARNNNFAVMALSFEHVRE